MSSRTSATPDTPESFEARLTAIVAAARELSGSYRVHYVSGDLTLSDATKATAAVAVAAQALEFASGFLRGAAPLAVPVDELGYRRGLGPRA